MFPNLETIGKWLVIAGFVIAVTGALIWLASRIFDWEKLPGTIRWQSGGITCVFPLLASILISVVLTVVLNLVFRGINK